MCKKWFLNTFVNDFSWAVEFLIFVFTKSDTVFLVSDKPFLLSPFRRGVGVPIRYWLSRGIVTLVVSTVFKGETNWAFEASPFNLWPLLYMNKKMKKPDTWFPVSAIVAIWRVQVYR